MPDVKKDEIIIKNICKKDFWVENMKKQISNGIILSFISQIISIVVGLTYTPLMIRILGQDEYGLYQLSQSLVNYLNLMNLGFNGAYIRYYSLAKAEGSDDDLSNINGMFMKTFLLISCLCLTVGFILTSNVSLLGNQITESQYSTAKILMTILVINLAISFPNSLYTAYISANERFAFQKAVNIILNIFIPILNLPLLYLGFGSIGLVFVTLLLSVVRLLLNYVFCKAKLGYKQNLRFFDKSIFQDLFKYTFFIFLSDMVDQLNSNVDKLLLGSLMGTVPVAIYSVAYNLNNYRVILSWIVPEMYVPKVNRLIIEEKDIDGTSLLFTKVGKLNNYLMILVISGFALIGKSFIELWVGSEYYLSYYCTLVLMISGYIAAVQALGVNVQNAMNMHRVRSMVYFVIACINVTLSVFLIKSFGVVGTCIGTLIASILGTGLFMNYYYKAKLGLKIGQFWKELFHWVIPAAVYFVFACFVLKGAVIHTWFMLFLIIILYSLGYFLLLWVVELDKDKRRNIKAYFQHIKRT